MLNLIIRFRSFSGYFLVAWILFIVVFSSIPSLPVIKIHTSKSEIRLDYLIHLAEYGLLGFLTFTTFAGEDFRPGIKRLIFLTVLLILFAFLDEFHQKFIPGRTFNIKDLYSNVSGIMLSLVFCLVVFRRLSRRRQINIP